MPCVLAQHAAVGVDDLALLHGAGAKAGDKVAVVTLGDEADVLALGLVGERQAQPVRVGAGLVLGQGAQGKAEEGQLLPRRGEEEVALVLGLVARPVQLGTGRRPAAVDIVAGGQRVGAEVAGDLRGGGRT